HWNTQAFFWSAIADCCSSSSAVFCYDLINEPLSPSEKRTVGKWESGTLFGGFDFLQFIALEPKGRSREQISAAWMRRMRDAIRAKDSRHLITVGLVGWDEKLHNVAGFAPEDVGRELDFVCIHVYPEKGKVPAAIEGLRKFATSKPL